MVTRSLKNSAAIMSMVAVTIFLSTLSITSRNQNAATSGCHAGTIEYDAVPKDAATSVPTDRKAGTDADDGCDGSLVAAASGGDPCNSTADAAGRGIGIGVTFVRTSEIQQDGIRLAGKTVLENLAGYDAVWQAQTIVRLNKGAWDYVRSHAPEKLMLRYVDMGTSQQRNPGTLDYIYIEANHPEWFLTKVDGASPLDPDNRIRVKDDPGEVYYNRFCLDIPNPAFQRWAIRQILAAVSGQTENLTVAYDGVAMDNVVLSAIQGWWNHRYDWKYKNKKTEWNTGVLDYLRELHKALGANDKKLIVNFGGYYELERDAGDWPALRSVVDGVLDEWSMGGKDGDGEAQPYADRKWELFMARHEDTVKAGLIDWWVIYPSKDEHFMYAYCSFLLIQQPGRSLFYCRPEGTDTASPSKRYPAYDIKLGSPAGNRYLKNQCWVRGYERGLVAVNPSSIAQTLDLTGSGVRYLDSADNMDASSLVLQPRAGKILLVSPSK